ncbi:MAG: acyl-CoA synthetase FdrA, partial [Candidatus Hodarchaeales archaeon]
MSLLKTHIIRNQYRDSVQLMRAASDAGKLEGIEISSVIMGTPKNKPLLKDIGLLNSEANNASANDIIISIRAETTSQADEAIQFIIDYLSKEITSPLDSTFIHRSIRGVLRGIPDANLAVISVPGEFAAREASIALDNDLNVLLFSANVPLKEEIRLKQKAHSRGLILMGPDCGTGMINGIGLGFANVVLPGPIGIVAASGTGTQEVMTLCHHHGVGVTHAIGTGSRDIKDKVGGISMIDGLHALDRDPSIQVIVIVSKPPEEETHQLILNEIQKCK